MNNYNSSSELASHNKDIYEIPLSLLSYFHQHETDEKRLFVIFGNQCYRHCVYCIAHNSHTNLPKFCTNKFLTELDSLIDSGMCNFYLFSLGALNEPLDSHNINDTIFVVRMLLERTNGFIQIATKCGAETINWFFSNISQNTDVLKRITIMYSLSTIKYVDIIEPDRENFTPHDRKMILSLATKHNYYIVPYIKPFLPGFTNNDSSLTDFLKNFTTAVVGYPYISKHVIRNTYYNFSFFNNTLPSALRLPQHHYINNNFSLVFPCLLNTEYNCTDFKFDLDHFVFDLQTYNLSIFYSSPCLVAYQHKLSCFTNVGHPNKGLHNILCSGNNKCPNVNCIYNSLYKYNSSIDIF